MALFDEFNQTGSQLFDMDAEIRQNVFADKTDIADGPTRSVS